MTNGSKDNVHRLSNPGLGLPPGGGNGGGGDLRERLAKLEAEMKHLATKADLEKMKADILEANTKNFRWVMGTGLAFASLALAIVRLWPGQG